jgi:hypothetical protein
MTPRPDRDYDDILSRVLRSTLDPIEPLGDGLAKIQQRIAEPWLKRQVSLLRTETSALGWLILVRCEPFFSWARSGLTAMAASAGRWFRPGPARRGAAAPASSRSGRHGGPRGRGRSADGLGWLGPAMTWLRPALAVAGAVLIVVAGVFAIQEAKNLALSPAANSSNNSGNSTGGQPGSHHKGNGSPQSSGATAPSHHATHQPSTTPAAKSKAVPSASCSPTPAPTTTSPTPTPTTPTPTTAPPTTPPPTTPPATTSPSPTAPAGSSIGSNNGGQPNDFAAVSFRAAGSVRGHVVLGSCGGPSPSSSSSGPTIPTFGSG